MIENFVKSPKRFKILDIQDSLSGGVSSRNFLIWVKLIYELPGEEEEKFIISGQIFVRSPTTTLDSDSEKQDEAMMANL